MDIRRQFSKDIFTFLHSPGIHIKEANVIDQKTFLGSYRQYIALEKFRYISSGAICLHSRVVNTQGSSMFFPSSPSPSSSERRLACILKLVSVSLSLPPQGRRGRSRQPPQRGSKPHNSRIPFLWHNAAAYAGSHGQNCVPHTKIHMLKSKPPASQNVTLFGDCVFIEMIQLK